MSCVYVRTLIFLLLFQTYSNACTTGSANDDLPNDPQAPHTSAKTKCDPTGLQFIDTGVYIGPNGCPAITLFAMSEESGNDAWAVEVGFDMRGTHDILEVYNHATSDSEREIIYIGDPNFVVYNGRYPLSGLEVVRGKNQIHYETYTYTEDGGVLQKHVVSQGDFELQVTLTDEVAVSE